MNIRIFLNVCVPLALVGCSGTPSVSDARAKLENQIQQQSNGLMRLVAFEKTDGAMQELMGMKGYTMSYSAEIEFLDDCLWSGGNNLTGWNGSFYAQRGKPKPPQEIFGRFFDLNQGLKPASKGERFRFTGQMNFERTERGWH